MKKEIVLILEEPEKLNKTFLCSVCKKEYSKQLVLYNNIRTYGIKQNCELLVCPNCYKIYKNHNNFIINLVSSFNKNLKKASESIIPFVNFNGFISLFFIILELNILFKSDLGINFITLDFFIQSNITLLRDYYEWINLKFLLNIIFIYFCLYIFINKIMEISLIRIDKFPVDQQPSGLEKAASSFAPKQQNAKNRLKTAKLIPSYKKIFYFYINCLCSKEFYIINMIHISKHIIPILWIFIKNILYIFICYVSINFLIKNIPTIINIYKNQTISCSTETKKNIYDISKNLCKIKQY